MGAMPSRPRRAQLASLTRRTEPSPGAFAVAARFPVALHQASVTLPMTSARRMVSLDMQAPVQKFPADGEALHNRTIKSVRVANGHVFLGSWDHTASMWELDSGEFIRSFRGHNQDIIGMCTHGEWLFTAGDCVRMWDTRTGQQMAAFGSKDEYSTATFYAAICDPVAVGLVVCAFCRGPLHVHDFSAASVNFLAQRGQHGARPVLVLEGHSAGVMGLAAGIAGGEHVIASASIDKTARLWCLRRGVCIRVLVGHEAALRDVAISEGGRVYTASLDLTAREWDPLTGACTRIFGGHLSPVRSLVVVGGILITAEAPHNTHPAGSRALREFDLQTGVQVHCHDDAHSSGIFHLFLLRPTGGSASAQDAAEKSTLFTASMDCFAKRWRLRGLAEGEGANSIISNAAARLGGEGAVARSGPVTDHNGDDDSSTHNAARPSGELNASAALAQASVQMLKKERATFEGDQAAGSSGSDEMLEQTRVKLEELEESMRCCVCLERPKNAAFVPCGHQSCRRCAENFRGKTCPICRTAVGTILALYG